jgi:hypothetical protein
MVGGGSSTQNEKPSRRMALVTILVTRVFNLYKPLVIPIGVGVDERIQTHGELSFSPVFKTISDSLDSKIAL